MKNNIRDTNNKELQEIIANTILLPDISNLDCLHEPITASFGLLLLYAQLYHYSENKERLFSKIVDIINAIRPLASLYAQNRNPVPQAGCLPDRARCASIFLFLSASEILTVDFFPKFRYAVLAFEFFCSQLLT